MILTAKQLNQKVLELKQQRDKANRELDDHLEKCILCQIEKQSALKVACMEGRRLTDNYLTSSEKLRNP
jgi:hypothetical protein